MEIIPWGNGKKKRLNNKLGRWDNQAFCVNSNDWVVFNWQGEGVGIVQVSTGKCFPAVKGPKVDYPDFFLGELPK
jgi:hypothetical protein